MAGSEDVYTDFMARKEEGKSHLLGPSSAHQCFRQSAFKYLGIEPSNPRSKKRADLGTLVHIGNSHMISTMYDPSERAADVRVSIPGLPRDGEADDVDFANRVVSDLKTISDEALERWYRVGPYVEYWDQLEVYGYGLWLKHGGDWTLRIRAINMKTGDEEPFEQPADPERGKALVEKIAERHRMLMGAVGRVAAGEQDPDDAVAEFPREGAGPGRGMPCDYCPWLSKCWPEPRDADGSPQSATIDPDDDAAIAAFALRYIEWSTTKREAEKKAKDALVFVAGVERVLPHPTDPDKEIVVSLVGGNPKEEPDCEAMVERLEELGERPIFRTVYTNRYTKAYLRKKQKPPKPRGKARS